MTFTKLFGIAFGWVCVVASARASVQIPDAVKQHIRDRVEAGYSPGIAVGLVGPDGTDGFCYGHTTLDRDVPVDEHTLFEIGSITKAFTAVLLAKLVEDGVVGLDDSVEKHLPPGTKVPSYEGRPITLRHLVSHTSGLPRLPDNMDPEDPADPYADYAVNDLYAFLAGHELSRDVGARYEYSNLGGGLLGHALEIAAGKPYEKLIRSHICKPLGLKNTVVKLSGRRRKKMATGHAGEEAVHLWNIDALAGAGALRSDLSDMLRFVRANLGMKESRLSAAIEATHRGRIATGMPDVSIALAWHVSSKHGVEIIWHNGGTGGFRSFCGFIPKTGVGAVVLANSNFEVDTLGMHLLDPTSELPAVQKSIATTGDALGRFVGYYQLAPGVVFDVTRKNDQLYAQLTGQDVFPVYAETETRFFYKVVDAKLTFHLDDHGHCDQLVLHQNGMDQVAKRLKPGEYASPVERTSVEVDPGVLKKYAGKYELQPGVIFDVRVVDGEITVKLTGQQRMPIYPESETKFFYKAVDAQITFVVNESSTVDELILHQAGMNRPAKRIK